MINVRACQGILIHEDNRWLTPHEPPLVPPLVRQRKFLLSTKPTFVIAEEFKASYEIVEYSVIDVLVSNIQIEHRIHVEMSVYVQKS